MSEFDAFIAAGLYDPDAPNAAERREYLAHLLARGHAPAEIIEIGRLDGPFTDVLASLGLTHVERLTAHEAAARAGMTVDEVDEWRAAFGVPVTSFDAAEIPATFLADLALAKFGAEIYGKERTLGFARIVGAAVSTLIEGGRELAWAPMQGRVMSELEVALANEAAMQTWLLVPDVVRRLMVERMGRDVWFEEHLRQGEVSMGVAFVDLIGSTDWTTRLTRAEHAAALLRFESAATRIAGGNGCRVVKFIGDEAMLVGVDVGGVAAAAAGLCRAIAEDAALPSARGAVGAGVVTPRGGDYFGDVVNITARAVKEARPGGVVVTADVAAVLDAARWDIDPLRAVDLRGLAHKVELADVVYKTSNTS